MAKPREFFRHSSHFYNLKQTACGNYVVKDGAAGGKPRAIGEGISVEICNSDPIDDDGFPCGWDNSRPRFFLGPMFFASMLV